jgi:hypothetical protein
MKTTSFSLAVFVIGSAVAVLGWWVNQDDPARTIRLDPRIGPAAPALYKSIRDAKDWENPYLVIVRDGVEVIARRAPSRRRTVTTEHLAQTLIDLPVSDWPYGKVIAVAEQHLRAGDGRDDKPIADNLNAALVVLRKLDLTVDRWP